MPRFAILLIVVLVLIVGVSVALSFINTETALKPVEKPIANEKLGL